VQNEVHLYYCNNGLGASGHTIRRPRIRGLISWLSVTSVSGKAVGQKKKEASDLAVYSACNSDDMLTKLHALINPKI